MTRAPRTPGPLPIPPKRRGEELGDEPPSPEQVRDGGISWQEGLEEKLRLLPSQSGVYLFRDSRGRVIYVGKARRLRSRVPSYFRPVRTEDPRLSGLRRRIRSLDWIVTASELEALILEDNLIKRYAPRYNIRLKDDKRYPYIMITASHPFPGMFLTRQVVSDGSRYFGPFIHVKDLRKTLRTVRSVFRLRNCTDRRLAQGGRECLQYFIGRCTAPCTQRVSREDYAGQVRPLIDFLSGRGEEAIRVLRQRMLKAAETLRYEDSASLRDDIAILQGLLDEQRMTPSVGADVDVVGLVSRGDMACGLFLHVREGRVLGKTHRILAGTQDAIESDQLRALLLATFLGAPRIPSRIVTAQVPRASDEIRSALAAQAGHSVEIQVAPRGPLRRLLAVAAENAHLVLEEEELRAAKKERRVDHAVYALQEALGLSSPPYRIEGYDISTIHGSHSVASRVVFQDGKPWKSAYRRFRISLGAGPDDLAMMGEVLQRRLRRLREREDTPPDLILVDGGRGQVDRALATLEEMGFAHLPLVGLAKREEELVLPHVDRPIRLPRSSEALKLLQRVRDEAHRFAVRYHRGLRTRAQKVSRLDAIPGIGPARRRELLQRFGSLEGIRRAREDELALVPGIGSRLSHILREALHGGGSDSSRAAPFGPKGSGVRDAPSGGGSS